MEMLLMGAVLALFGIAVSCMAFGAATRSEEEEPVAAKQAQPELAKAASVPARFFVEPAAVPAPAVAVAARVPMEALLLQIENHVRLEQAAAESFMAAPDAVRLHSRTISPFIN
ncbi:MAG: hypothetical protein JST11_15265 [Acidobacteria bacterium]|nr:hypothetical protein [Acidobacteriota bacterium]